MRTTKDFDRILLEAIDEGLTALGDGGKYMVFFYLEKNYSIRKHDIPKNPEAFVKGLEKIFGAGTTVLEKMIVKSICSKLGIDYERREGQRLVDCIRELNLALTQPPEEPERRDKNASLASSENVEGAKPEVSVLRGEA